MCMIKLWLDTEVTNNNNINQDVHVGVAASLRKDYKIW